MPVLVWEQRPDGLEASVETSRETLFSAEELRDEAEALDRQLDILLDETVAKAKSLQSSTTPIEFVRAWAIGNALREDEVLQLPALKNEPRPFLWLALARKCRLGAHADGAISNDWLELRPSTTREPRREGKRLDHFELCLWLAEQTFEDAVFTFGGSIRNGWQMLERPALRPPVVREALKTYLGSLSKSSYASAVEPPSFAELMKALRGRWPDRGPGSAKRPIHFTPEALVRELSEVLDPLVNEEEAE